MVAIFQTTFSNTFSWKKTYKFWLELHWSVFVRVQLTIFQHWFRWWVSADQVTSHFLNLWWLNYWCICVTRPQWVKHWYRASITSSDDVGFLFPTGNCILIDAAMALIKYRMWYMVCTDYDVHVDGYGISIMTIVLADIWCHAINGRVSWTKIGTMITPFYLYNGYPYARKDSLCIVMVFQWLQLCPTEGFQDVMKKDIHSVQYHSINLLGAKLESALECSATRSDFCNMRQIHSKFVLYISHTMEVWHLFYFSISYKISILDHILNYTCSSHYSLF